MAEFDAFAYILDNFGEPAFAKRLSETELGAFRGRVPNALLDFLHDHGTGSWQDGTFTLCHPALLAPVVDAVFAGDPVLDPAAITAIGYGPFGTLVCWHPSGNMLTVRFLEGTVFEAVYDPDKPTRPELKGLPRATPGFTIGSAVMNGIGSAGDPPYTSDGEPMFPQAVARLGALAPGEVYGFVPALGFGGEARLENVARLGVVEHLLYLSQVTTLQLQHLEPATPEQPFGVLVTVRVVGSGGR